MKFTGNRLHAVAGGIAPERFDERPSAIVFLFAAVHDALLVERCHIVLLIQACGDRESCATT